MMIPDYKPEPTRPASIADSLERIARALEGLLELAESAARPVYEEEG